MRTLLPYGLCAIGLLGMPQLHAADQVSGFIGLIDKQNNFGDSRRAVVFYEVADLTIPMFAVYAGQKRAGDSRSPDSIAADGKGNVYLLAVDRDFPQGTVIDNTGSTVEDNTDGDYDLLKINLSMLYQDWTDQRDRQYVTYNYQPLSPPGVEPPPEDFGRGHETGGECQSGVGDRVRHQDRRGCPPEQ